MKWELFFQRGFHSFVCHMWQFNSWDNRASYFLGRRWRLLASFYERIEQPPWCHLPDQPQPILYLVEISSEIYYILLLISLCVAERCPPWNTLSPAPTQTTTVRATLSFVCYSSWRRVRRACWMWWWERTSVESSYSVSASSWSCLLQVWSRAGHMTVVCGLLVT